MKSIVVGNPLQLVAVDIVGSFPTSQNNNSYISNTVRFSPPEQLNSDQGRQFESSLVKNQIHKTHITLKVMDL